MKIDLLMAVLHRQVIGKVNSTAKVHNLIEEWKNFIQELTYLIAKRRDRDGVLTASLAECERERLTLWNFWEETGYYPKNNNPGTDKE